MKSFTSGNLFLILFIICTNFDFMKAQIYEKNYTCENISKGITQNETALLSYVKTHMDSLEFQSNSCIDAFVKYCKITALDYYLNELCKRGIQYKENLEISLNTILTGVNEVYNKHKYTEEDYQDVIPASRWAQNMDEIFIELKFAHRHDSPGCLEMKNLKVEIKDKSVKLVGYCVLGDVPIKMNYDVKLWSKINVGESRHFVSSVGRYQFNLKKKKKNTYWKRLLDEKMTIPTNMRVWFEMKEKYQDQIAKYENAENEETLQDIVNRIEEEEKKKEKKKEKKDKKEKKGKKKKKKKSKKSEDL